MNPRNEVLGLVLVRAMQAFPCLRREESIERAEREREIGCRLYGWMRWADLKARGPAKGARRERR